MEEGGRDPVAPWRDADAQVLVEDLRDVHLDDASVHHLVRVLRLRSATLCATDGAGGWRLVRFDGGDRPEPLGPDRREPAHPRPLTVGFAPAKGERPELVVQKLTELGIDRIVPFVSRRSVVRWDAERGDRQLERWRRIAREACGQCRRLHLPELVGATGGGLVELADLVRPSTGSPPACADAGGAPIDAAVSSIVVGPEGGWAPGEVDGLRPVSVSAQILRAETAAIAVGSMMAALRDGWVRPGG